MAFSHLQADDGDVMSEINMIPLIDVMLVLLIVFMITVPVMTHSVNVQLPQAASEPVRHQPETIRVSVQADGVVHWNQTVVTQAELETKLAQAALLQPQPAVHIRGDKAARYEHVAAVLAASQRAGIRTLGFVTEP